MCESFASGKLREKVAGLKQGIREYRDLVSIVAGVPVTDEEIETSNRTIDSVTNIVLGRLGADVVFYSLDEELADKVATNLTNAIASIAGELDGYVSFLTEQKTQQAGVDTRANAVEALPEFV